MKKLVILTLILAAGLTAYPQSANRSSKQSKSKSSSSVSKSRSSASKSSKSSRPKAVKSKSSSSRSKKAVSPTRSSASKSRSTKAKSGSSSVSSRSKGNQSRSSKSGKSAVQSRSYRSSAVKSGVNRSSSRSSSGNSAVRSNQRISSPQKSSRTVTSSSSAVRSNRSGNVVYERRDGKKFKHDNNRVFAARKYRVDYHDARELRRSNDFIRVYNNYDRWHRNRYHRHIVVRNYHIHAPLALDIRRARYPYRRPVHIDLCWTPFLHQRFMYYYPLNERWNRNYGDYIESVSSYDAMNYVGTVKKVYGKVEEVYYSPEDRTYTLYFGAPFPYHDFSVVIPRDIAKDISWSPTWHFEDEHVWVVGLVDIFDDKAEIVIHDQEQIRRY